ncbi:MAG: LVIVD repeat-containing protein, partial [Halobaculum sp.]
MQRRQVLRRTAALSAVPALSSRAATAATGSGDSADSGDSAGPIDPTAASTPTDTPTGYAPLGSLPAEGAKEIVVDGDTGYLAVGDGYAVVDLAEPTNPTLLARETGLTPPDSDTAFRYIWDVKVADDRLLVPAQGVSKKHELGFAVADVSDPANPTTVFVEPTSFSIHNSFLDGTTAYLTGGAGDAGTMTVYDVSGDSA